MGRRRRRIGAEMRILTKTNDETTWRQQHERKCYSTYAIIVGCTLDTATTRRVSTRDDESERKVPGEPNTPRTALRTLIAATRLETHFTNRVGTTMATIDWFAALAALGERKRRLTSKIKTAGRTSEASAYTTTKTN